MKSSLPTDLESCHALLAEQARVLAEKDQVISEKERALIEKDQVIDEKGRVIVSVASVNTELAEKNSELKLLVEKLTHLLYGRKSERLVDDPRQQMMDFDKTKKCVDGSSSDSSHSSSDSTGSSSCDVNMPAMIAAEAGVLAGPSIPEVSAEVLAEARRIIREHDEQRRARPKDKPRSEQFPAHLPRYEVTLQPTEQELRCLNHGEKMIIGYQSIETLEMEPPKLKVRVTKRPKLACRNHPECGVIQVSRPQAGLLEGDRFDTSVAVEILVAKWYHHLPLYRLQNIFASMGWCPSRSTLDNIASTAIDLLGPLIEYLREEMLRQSTVICLDDTRVTLVIRDTKQPLPQGTPRECRQSKIIAEALKNKRPSITAHLWGYYSVDVPINVYDFTVSRHREGPKEVLRDFAGTAMGDCWSGWEGISLESSDTIDRAACWSHARRKFTDIFNHSPLHCSRILAMMRQLFAIEVRGKSLTSEQRLSLRRTESVPVLTRLHNYINDKSLSTLPPKFSLAGAINYLHNHWDALCLFTTNGDIPLDNNIAEQMMKHVATGRKNWLKLESIDGGDRAASILTLISSANRNDLDPSIYLKDVLDRLLSGDKDYASMRPDIWKQSHPEAVRIWRQEERRYAAERDELRRARRVVAQAEEAEKKPAETQQSKGGDNRSIEQDMSASNHRTTTSANTNR